MIWLILALLVWLGGWALNSWLARRGNSRAVRIAIPVIFGLTLLVIWEALVRGFGISPVILPAPSAVGQTFAASTGILWVDFHQTVVKGALRGLCDWGHCGLCRRSSDRPVCVPDAGPAAHW